MDVLYIVDSFPKLSETFILNPVQYLIQKESVNLHIFALAKPEDTKQHNIVKSLNLANLCTYYSPKNKFQNYFSSLTNIIKAFFKYRKSIKKNSPKKLSLSFFNELKYLPLLMQDFEHYDIVHCHFATNLRYGVILKKYGLCKKIVVTYYGYDVGLLLEDPHRFENLRQYVDLHLPICQYFKNILLEHNISQEKIQIHHIGVDFNHFTLSHKSRLEKKKQQSLPKTIDIISEKIKRFISEPKAENHINILSVARFTEKKGLHYSIRALKQAIDMFNPQMVVKYNIAGYGPDSEKLQKLVQSLELEDVVQFLGPVNISELVNLYQYSDIFLLNSITAEDGDIEGTPTVLIEASGMGLPIISSNYSGIPEIVLDQQSGFLTQERDIETIAHRLSDLVNSVSLRESMGQQGMTYVRKNFSNHTQNSQLLQYYFDLLS